MSTSTTPLSRGSSHLASWGLLRASGADARTFLHGQLSNDLLALGAGEAHWTAYCSAKGRMLAGFLAWHDADGNIMLACDGALAPVLMKRLRMFVLRAKVVIEDAGAAFRLTGVIGDARGPAPFVVRHEGTATLVGLPSVEGVSRHLLIEPLAAASSASGDDSAWNTGMIRAGESWITAATQDQFVPQMVNLDALGGINFKKGCYPGQEVVARAHYRGAVKRRMYRALVEGQSVSPQPGQALFSSGATAQECGQVANAVLHADGTCELLAVVSMQSRAESPIHLGSPDGPVLAFVDLPYALPEAA